MRGQGNRVVPWVAGAFVLLAGAQTAWAGLITTPLPPVENRINHTYTEFQNNGGQFIYAFDTYAGAGIPPAMFCAWEAEKVGGTSYMTGGMREFSFGWEFYVRANGSIPSGVTSVPLLMDWETWTYGTKVDIYIGGGGGGISFETNQSAGDPAHRSGTITLSGVGWNSVFTLGMRATIYATLTENDPVGTKRGAQATIDPYFYVDPTWAHAANFTVMTRDVDGSWDVAERRDWDAPVVPLPPATYLGIGLLGALGVARTVRRQRLRAPLV